MNITQTQSGAIFKISRIWKPRSEKSKQKLSAPADAAQMLNSSEALLKIISEKQNWLQRPPGDM